MHSNTRQALNASTRQASCLYWTRYNHALEHSTGSERVDAPSFLSLLNASKLTFRYPSSLINHSTLLLERSSAKLLVFYAGSPANNHALEHSTGSEQSCTRTLDRLWTRRSVRSTRKLLGKSRQAHQRTAGSPANAKLTFRYPSSLINHSTLLLERSSAKLLVFYASTRSRRAVEVIICMITRDFSVISMTSQASLSLSLSLLLTKVTHAQYRKRFRVSYNMTRAKGQYYRSKRQTRLGSALPNCRAGPNSRGWSAERSFRIFSQPNVVEGQNLD